MNVGKAFHSALGQWKMADEHAQAAYAAILDMDGVVWDAICNEVQMKVGGERP